ncbi:hypothetical protein ABZV67_21920 [Streptomyces sp. NPDC005065]|uniref:hypothetical protein n=1 Tax=Streptomyces sp. NPDC005065 TaxID=3154461 RepID=UPI00339DD80D
MSTAAPVRADARTLISDELFGRLVNRIVKDEGVDQPLAERIMTDAVAALR